MWFGKFFFSLCLIFSWTLINNTNEVKKVEELRSAGPHANVITAAYEIIFEWYIWELRAHKKRAHKNMILNQKMFPTSITWALQTALQKQVNFVYEWGEANEGCLRFHLNRIKNARKRIIFYVLKTIFKMIFSSENLFPAAAR